MPRTILIITICLLSCLHSNAQNNVELNKDSIKQILIGNWEYQEESHKMKLAEHLNYYKEIPDFAKRRLKRIAGVEITDSLKIEVTEDDKFIISNSKKDNVEYKLSIYEKRLWISRSDIVITNLYYEIDEEISQELEYQ